MVISLQRRQRHYLLLVYISIRIVDILNYPDLQILLQTNGVLNQQCVRQPSLSGANG